MRFASALALVLFLALAAFQPGASASPAAEAPFLVSGTVTDADGAPMADVQVLAIGVANGSVHSAQTNSTGAYSVPLPAGTYNLSASLAGHAANITYYLVPVSSDLDGLDFTMSLLPGSVTGFVTSGDAPVPGVKVTLTRNGQNYSANTTAPFGRYDITGVAPGFYLAKAEKGGFWTTYAPGPVEVLAGEAATVNFTLIIQPAGVYGVVTLGGVGEAGVKVQLLSQGSVVTEAVTDTSGNFSIANVPSGEYIMVLTKEGLEDKSVPVSLQPFADQRVDVAMAREPVQGGDGFIDGLDLTHSMMVVGLIVSVLLMLFALFIKIRSSTRPELLAKEDEEEQGQEK